MQCTCQQHHLARALAVVGHAVASRPTLPILANVRLVAERSGRLTLAATNLEIGITCWIDAQVQKEGVITVPAKVFTELVTNLPSDYLDLVAAEETSTMPTLQITGSRSHAALRGLDAVEFPHIPSLEQVEQEASMTLAATLLKEMVESIAFAASTDETRPPFTGILMQFEPEARHVTLAAADSLCLAVRTEPLIDPIDITDDLLVPARTLVDLVRILPADGNVRIVATPRRSQVLFHTERIELVSRLIDARFPAYRQIIPAECVTRAVLDTRELVAVIRSVAPFARENSNITRMTIAPGSEDGLAPGAVIIEAASDALGTTTGTIPATITGPKQQIIFNVSYLADVLAALHHTTTVALEVNAPDRAAVLRSLARAAMYVVMPMSIKQGGVRA